MRNAEALRIKNAVLPFFCYKKTFEPLKVCQIEPAFLSGYKNAHLSSSYLSFCSNYIVAYCFIKCNTFCLSPGSGVSPVRGCRGS